MKTTRYEQVAERILNLIKNGVLKEGDKIPSLRRLSQELGVSVNTVKEAYWKLEDRNYIMAVPQSGFYVKKQTPDTERRRFVDPSCWDPQDVSLCRVYGAFQDMGLLGDGAALGIATLPHGFRPSKRMGRFIQEAVRDNENEAFDYLMPPGYAMLREQIARLGISSGENLAPDDIIVTNGCHEAIFLSLMAVCRPGDAVVFESPIYFNLLQLLRQLNLKIIEIPGCSREGVNIDTLRFVIENHPVKAMFTISNFNNPLGFSIPSVKKKKLVELLNEKGIPLIEDDIYGDLFFENRPDTCKSHDSDGNVLLCSSFSKTIAPGLRLGWVAPGKFYDQVIGNKMLLNISTASVNQIAVAKFLKEGGYERHLRMLRKKLREQISAMRSSVLKYFPSGTQVTAPGGGMLLWVELPDAIDSYQVYREALKKNIIIAPGPLFTMKDKYANCLRLNAGTWTVNVEKALQYLGGLCAACGNPN